MRAIKLGNSIYASPEANISSCLVFHDHQEPVLPLSRKRLDLEKLSGIKSKNAG